MTLITVTNCKGGVAKTTTAVALAAGIANTLPPPATRAADTDKVLLVDGDSQGHVALSFGLPVRCGLFDWLVRGLPLADCILRGRPDQLELLPGDSLTKTVKRLYGDSVEFEKLVARLRGLKLPWVVIDTAAGGLFQEAALAASDQVVIPFRAETLGIDSMFQTLEIIRQIAPGARVTMLPTAFDMRLKEQRENLQMVVNEFGESYGLGTDWDGYAIRTRTAVAEATSYGKTIFEYNGQGIQDVRRGYAVLMNRVMALANEQVAVSQKA
jgi:chromosome partitioning protein